MRTFFNDFLVQLKGIWARLDGGQRLIVVAVLGATVVGLGGIVWYAGQPSYESVCTPNSPEEIAQAQQALQSAGISYTTDDLGRTFLVERSKVGLAYLALNKAGVNTKAPPSIGGTSSLMDDAATKAFKLDQASIGMAQDAILGLTGVVAVKVTANKPRRQSAFRDRDRENKPSATVLLSLKSGGSWNDIAKAAANLTASQLMIPLDNVTVFSASGLQRYQYDPDKEAGLGSSEFLNMQRQMAEEKAALAQEGLDRMWPGLTNVSVTVDLDPNWEITVQKVLPPEPLVKTEKTTKDDTSKTTGKAPDPNGATTDPANSDKQKNETKDRTYVTDIGERRSGKQAPDIKRMTVAVLYDKKLEKSEGFSKDDLVKTVKSIVGWDKKRDQDDDFSTMSSDFATVDFGAELASGPGIADLALRWGPTVGQILGVIVVVMFLKGLFKRSSAGSKGSTSEEPLVAASARNENLSPEDQQKKMRKEIEKAIANDPAALAKLLESWLVESKA